jgi:hypothetical protein
MFKKTIQFQDLEDNTVQDVFYFSFTKLEIMKMLELEDLEGKVERLGLTPDAKGLTELENVKEAYAIFEDLVLRAYGKKSADNRKFLKKDPVTGAPYRDEFEASPAMSELIIEFLQNPSLGAEFVEKCLPPKLIAEAKADGKLPEGGVAALVEEANRRQQDPETAVQPGVPPADIPTAPPVLDDTAAEEPKKFTDYTEQELLEMPQDQFLSLLPKSPKDWSPDQMMIAYQKKSAQ